MKKSIFGFIFVFTLFQFLLSQSVFALNPATGPGTEQERFESGEKTKEVSRRLEEEAPAAVEVQDKAEAPAEAQLEEVPFFVETINITGNTAIPTQELRPIAAPHENKELRLSEVKKIAEDLTDYYRSKGYITSRCFIPAQKLESKILEIRVLEGKLGNVEVQGNRYFQKANISRFLKIPQGGVIRYEDLKRDVYTMNLHPDREVKAVILPGKELGTSDLLLDVKDNFPLHIGGEINNFGTELTGEERYSVSLRHNNLFGYDDIFVSRMQFGEEVFAVGLQYALPVGPWDTQVGAAFNYTDVSIGGDFSILDIAGEAFRYSIFFNQPFLDTQHIDLTWTGSFESKDINNTILGQPSSTDDLRMLHTGINIDEIDSHGRMFIVNDLTFGLDALGASTDNDPRVSRQGAGGSFFKYNGSLNRIHPVVDSTTLYLRGTAQLSGDKLVSAEQYDIGGIYSVRGYPQSDYLGDYGYGGSAELRVPMYFIPREAETPWGDKPLWNSINFVGFFDAAHATLRNPAVGERAEKNSVGVGAGIRVDLPRNFTARVEWAVPVGDDPTDRSNSHVYFSIAGDLF